MRITNPVGVLGEDAAVSYLKNKGYKILERNFRKRNTEIDIIAIQTRPGPTLTFIEVKTRTSNAYGTPFEGIALWKVQNLVKTAQFYKLLNPKLPDDMRIDAVGVFVENGRIKKIEHLENISGF